MLILRVVCVVSRTWEVWNSTCSQGLRTKVSEVLYGKYRLRVVCEMKHLVTCSITAVKEWHIAIYQSAGVA